MAGFHVLGKQKLTTFQRFIESKYEDMGDMILPHNTNCKTVGTVVCQLP